MPISRQYALAGVEKSVSTSDRLCRKAVPLPFVVAFPVWSRPHTPPKLLQALYPLFDRVKSVDVCRQCCGGRV